MARLRGFRMDDYEEVRGVWDKSGLKASRGDGREEVRKKLRRDRELFLVAEEGGRIVGTVLGAWDGRRGWIYHLGVLPEYQRRGIARELVTEVEKRMRRKGVSKVNAVVFSWNGASLAFFDEMGYGHHEALTLHGKVLREDSLGRFAKASK
ncbi:MAG: GNAT family acetyltransferase [archaeon]|nr:MAG: GNAT family acetyltransferase [archaeon]